MAREAVIAGPEGVVVAGGLVTGDESTASAYRLDLAGGRATGLHDLLVPVHDVGGVLSRGRYLVIGGGNASEQATVQSLGSRPTWRRDLPLPSARSDLSAVRFGTGVVIVGGYDGNAPALPDVLRSGRGQGWTVVGQLRVPVRYPAVCAGAGAVWVFGGERAGVMVDAIQRIDTETGRVRVVGHLPGPLGHAAAVTIGSRILVAGGRTGQTGQTSAMWWFSPRGGHLQRAGRLPSPLSDSAVVRRGGSVYLVGGETPGLSDRVLRIRYS